MGDEALMAFVIIVLVILTVGLWIKKTIREAQEKASKDETVPIYGLDNAAEAVTLKSMLEDNDIACIIDSFENRFYSGVWQSQQVWGILKVLTKDQARAESLISTYFKALETEETEEEPP